MSKTMSTMQRTNRVLLVITLFLVGFVAMQALAAKDLKNTLYGRCVQNAQKVDADDAFRLAEIEAFSKLASVARPATAAEYRRLVDKAQAAVNARQPVDCSIYK